HPDHLEGAVGGAGGLQQGGEVGAGAGDQDDDAGAGHPARIREGAVAAGGRSQPQVRAPGTMGAMSSEQKNDQGKSSGGSNKETAAARHRRLVGGLTLALLASWLLMLAPLPFSLLAGVTGLVALVLLFPLIVRSFKAGRRAVAVMAIVVGIPATLMVVGVSLI